MYPSVGVCTLPIDDNLHDLQKFEHSNPTNLSINRLTIAASTNAISNSLGLFIASLTAFSVISLNVILFIDL